MEEFIKSLEALMASVSDIPKKIIQSGEECVPVGFILAKSGDGTKAEVMIPDPVDLSLAPSKEVWVPALSKLAKMFNADGFMIISEAWMNKSKEKDASLDDMVEAVDLAGGSVKNLPGSQECIFMSCQFFDGLLTFYCIPFSRGEKNEPIWGEPVFTDNRDVRSQFGGRLMLRPHE